MTDTSNIVSINRVIGRPMAKGYDERRNYEGRPRVRFSRLEHARQMAEKYKEEHEKVIQLNYQLALNSPDISIQQKCMDRVYEYSLAKANADIGLDADIPSFVENTEMSVLNKEDDIEIKSFIAEKIKKRIAEQKNGDS